MGAGRRDFGDLGARLERHLERLPDYAQRAQEKLQRYFPPEQGAGRPNPLRRPAPRPVSITDVPVFAEARAKFARWNDPSARLARRTRRTSRALTLWIVAFVLCVLYALAAGFGLLSGVGGVSESFGGIAGAVIFGALGVRSGLKLRELKRTQLPAGPAATPSLPPAGSAAREPMERLAEGESSLAELLRQLRASALVDDDSVEESRATAASAASALRALAARLQAIERARRSAPAGERNALDAAVRQLKQQLDEGLEDYGALVAAAGHAVAAGGSSLRPSKDALADATDRLAGLAIALREIS